MKRVQKENSVEALYNFWDDKELLVSIKRSAGNAALNLGYVLSLFLTDTLGGGRGGDEEQHAEDSPISGRSTGGFCEQNSKTAPSFTTGPQLKTNKAQLLPLEILNVLKIYR